MLGQQTQSQLSRQKKKQFVMGVARTEDEIREAQRLRYRVFVEEMGARLPGGEEWIDKDMYDPFCEHLLVRDTDTNEVVGTYRILTPEQAKNIGGYYSADS